MGTPGWIKAMDFTDKRQPLGGVVRTAISAVPGGNAVLGTIDAANAAKRSGTTSRNVTAAPPPATTGGGSTTAGVVARSRWAEIASKPIVWVGAGVAVVVLLGVLVFGRRKHH